MDGASIYLFVSSRRCVFGILETRVLRGVLVERKEKMTVGMPALISHTLGIRFSNAYLSHQKNSCALPCIPATLLRVTPGLQPSLRSPFSPLPTYISNRQHRPPSSSMPLARPLPSPPTLLWRRRRRRGAEKPSARHHPEAPPIRETHPAAQTTPLRWRLRRQRDRRAGRVPAN